MMDFVPVRQSCDVEPHGNVTLLSPSAVRASFKSDPANKGHGRLSIVFRGSKNLEGSTGPLARGTLSVTTETPDTRSIRQ
jgi:hypothetical protein